MYIAIDLNIINSNLSSRQHNRDEVDIVEPKYTNFKTIKEHQLEL